jgi:hypothetical protein
MRKVIFMVELLVMGEGFETSSCWVLAPCIERILGEARRYFLSPTRSDLLIAAGAASDPSNEGARG